METVSFAACRRYADAAGAVDRALAGIGGWERFVTPGLRVLVKPNLLMDRPPEAAVTTHPDVLRAVIRALRARGADVAVGDSPANAVRQEKVWERTGTRSVCVAEGVPLLNFEQIGTRRIPREGEECHVAIPALDAGLIVNLPKVKTHVLTTLTAAVKNLYGTLPGYQKTRLHAECGGPKGFSRLLRDVAAALPRQLCIADGVVGMEGAGPSGGKPVELGFVAASADPVALDLALCDALRVPRHRVPYLAEYAGPPPVEAYRLTGDDPAALRLPRLRLPVTWHTRFVPDGLARLLRPLLWVRPRIGRDCLFCGRCIKACPKDALVRDPDVRHPVLKGFLCIGCCCCHEVCPAYAIRMRCSPLMRPFGIFSDLR
jgi:uncharacterized protein (DUF362 family)/ferredoxin